MSVNSVQTTYRRSVNPFVAGQIANGRDVQIESARLIQPASNDPIVLPFGYAVGLVDGPADGTGTENRYHLKGHACARKYVVTSNALTNFGGVAIRNVALPGAGTQVQGAPDGTERVVDAYNLNDLVSVGGEGDFVVRIFRRAGVANAADNISVRGAVSVVTADTNTGGASNVGMFTNNSTVSGVTKATVDGAIFMTDSALVTPYSGGDAQLLAVVRIRQQPR